MRNTIAKKLRKFTESRTEGETPTVRKRLYKSLKKEYLKASGRDKGNMRNILNQMA